MDASEAKSHVRRTAQAVRVGALLGATNQLSELVRLYGGTDKWWHGYTPYYERHLASRRLDKLVVYEIGVGGYESKQAGGSLAIWRDYFLRSRIVGIDISDKSISLGSRVSFMRADQSSARDLSRVVAVHGPPDIVIDDGSHVGSHISASFNYLWPLMPSGATYAIEDLSTSYYPSFGGGNPPPSTTAIGLLAELIDSVQAQDPTFNRKAHWGTRADPEFSDVASVHVYPGVAFLEKA